jgi:deoxyribonuclease-4
MAIFVGPGGAPISSPDRSTLAGIKECARLGLNAMEVEFVRGVKMSAETAGEVGKAAAENGVRLSVHAPYYINLISKDAAIVKKSIERIVDSLHRGHLMGADAVAVHAAYFGELSPDDAMEQLVERTKDILDAADKRGASDIRLGYETMAKRGQWGSLEETVEMCRLFKKRVVPYLDWGHLFARGGGKIDYAAILDALEKLKLVHINSHFNCVRESKTGDGYVDIHEPVAKKTPDFAPLAKELVRRKADITLICETPLLEEDALKMKAMLEKAGAKIARPVR